jgi:hypothetical protein
LINSNHIEPILKKMPMKVTMLKRLCVCVCVCEREREREREREGGREGGREREIHNLRKDI